MAFRIRRCFFSVANERNLFGGDVGRLFPLERDNIARFHFTYFVSETFNTFHEYKFYHEFERDGRKKSSVRKRYEIDEGFFLLFFFSSRALLR